MHGKFGSIVATTAFLLLAASPARADTVSIPWIGNVISGPEALIGSTWSGTLSFDDSVFDSEGDVTLSGEDGLVVTLDFRGQTFSNQDDTDFPAYPRAAFFNGELFDLNFLILDGDGQGQELFDGDFGGTLADIFHLDTFGGVAANGDGSFTIGMNVNVVEVPEPSKYLSMLAGLGLLGVTAGARRRLPLR